MKAAVCYNFRQPLVIEEIEIDAPKQGEVKIRMAATAICHSDIHLLYGEWGGALPVVAGHECAGIVADTGPDVTSVGYYAHPNQLLAKGIDAIRARHILRFQEPNLFGKLEYRDVIGNIVIDHELVSRTFPEGTGTVKVVCMYEVIDNKITQAWFLVGIPIIDQSSS